MASKFPDFSKISDEPVYNTKAMVQLSGVAAPTLRAWERRYRIVSPERAENTYRLYSERDVAKVRWLREQVEHGLSISRAADLLERTLTEQTSAQPASPPVVYPELSPAATPETGGGELSFEHLQADLLDAFQALDEPRAQSIMSLAFSNYGVEDYCNRLVEPVMLEVGERWMQDDLTVSIEHFASALVRGQLETLLKMAPRSGEQILVLTACAPGEYHEIGLLIVSLFLRRQGFRVVYLGQNVQVDDFIKTIEQVQPAFVILSCCTMESLGGLVELLRRLEELPEEQRPGIGYGGRIFITHPELACKLPGHYLGPRAPDTVKKIRGILLSR